MVDVAYCPPEYEADCDAEFVTFTLIRLTSPNDPEYNILPWLVVKSKNEQLLTVNCAY